MKQLTVSFSMPRTTKTIILTWIIISAVLLSVLGSITVSADEFYELPYILCMTHESTGVTLVYASSGPIRVLSTSNSTSSSYVKGLASYNTIYMVQIGYNEELGDWVTIKNDYQMYTTDQAYYIYGTSTKVSSGTPVYWHLQSNYDDYSIITNSAMNSREQALFSGYSDDLSTLPTGLSESTIQSIIEQQLNNQTDAGETAETLNTQTQSVYNDYQNGIRTREEVQVLLEVYAEELNSLTPSTLLDAMQINNALTYNQTIQQIINSTSSTTVQQQILEHVANAIGACGNYQYGLIEQPEALQQVTYSLMYLLQMISDGTAKSEADINAVNSAVNIIESAKNAMIEDQEDIKKDIADDVIGSDVLEKAYLEQLLMDSGEKTVTDISPAKNFTQTQKNDAKALMDVIWENEFVKRLVPLCAGFMVVCVALGVKYKV